MASASAPSAPRSRRQRDPLSTYDAILTAARDVMAERGPEALTVSEVAHRAGVNRGTAYQHFRTREHLLDAVKKWFAGELNRMLGEGGPTGARMDSLLEFLSEHREVARLWLFALLGDGSDSEYEGWQRYLGVVEGLAESDLAQDGIDAEMLARILVAATMVWSLWAPKLAGPDGDTRVHTKRFARELRRLLLFGVMRPERWPDLVSSLQDDIEHPQVESGGRNPRNRYGDKAWKS
jgi:AcrR family transcriptional regulator